MDLCVPASGPGQTRCGNILTKISLFVKTYYSLLVEHICAYLH